MLGFRIVREEYLSQLEIANEAKTQMLRDYEEMINVLHKRLADYAECERARIQARLKKGTVLAGCLPAQVIPLL